MLRHDKILKKGKLKKHLSHVPSYLVPDNVKIQELNGDGRKTTSRGKKRKGAFGDKAAAKKKGDPLQNFSFNPSKKSVREGLGKKGKGKGEAAGAMGTFSRELLLMAGFPRGLHDV